MLILLTLLCFHSRLFSHIYYWLYCSNRFIHSRSHHLHAARNACGTFRFYKWKICFLSAISPLFDGKFTIFSLQVHTLLKKISCKSRFFKFFSTFHFIILRTDCKSVQSFSYIFIHWLMYRKAHLKLFSKTESSTTAYTSLPSGVYLDDGSEKSCCSRSRTSSSVRTWP